MNDLEETLIKIAKIFNELEIKWNVGGSVLLAQFGLYENPHDIDIITSKEDVEKAKVALARIGTQIQVPVSEVFVSDHYYKFDIDGTEIDLISGFKIKHNQGIYEYKSEFGGGKNSFGVAYAPLEDWYILYSLMPKGRKKANAIKRFLEEKEEIERY